LTKLNWIQCAT